MCGITGIFAFTPLGQAFQEKVFDAVEAMKSRGPDNQAVFHHQHVSLGHMRLSVIDTSPAANQPFTDHTGRYTIVYNGEIYNHKELRNELIREKGISFRTNSDTEVLLYQYITDGPDMLEKLNGFFAIAIYDYEEDILFLARDRIGIKPFIIYQDEDKLIFASEMKGIMAYGIPKKPDFVSIFTLLQLNYIPAPQTILQGVRKLASGSYILISKKEIITKSYYRIPVYNSDQHLKLRDYESAKKTLYLLLEESVRKRLISDVPLGAFLSGGVDSSIIVALASKYVKDFNTFSIGFRDEPYFDETLYARMVADKYKTRHTVFSLSTDDIFEIFFKVLDYIDEPFADSSALAVYILSRYTREHVKVALSGDGADELFSGYNKHTAEYYARRGGFRNYTVRVLTPALKYFPQSRNNRLENFFRQMDRFAEGLKMDEKERYWRWCAFTSETESDGLMKHSYNTDDYFARKKELLKTIHQKGSFNEVLYTDLQLVLQNDMLVKIDLMSMAHALEVRVPFLDHEVVNFVSGLPPEYKIQGNIRKRILQDTFRELLPDAIYQRPKHGFEVPLLKWFRTSLRSKIDNEWLRDEYISAQGIFQPEAIRKLKQKLFSSNPGDVHAQIWCLIVFQYWWKKYIEM